MDSAGCYAELLPQPSEALPSFRSYGVHEEHRALLSLTSRLETRYFKFLMVAPPWGTLSRWP